MATVNAIAYDFTSISLSGYNYDLSDGINSISYGHTMEVTKIKGTRKTAYGRTVGTLDAEDMEWELLEWAANAFRQKLGAGYMLTEWPCTVSYKNDGSPLVTDTIQGCRIIGEKKSPKQGSDALVVTFTISVMNLLLDGISPV